jgi:4-amino-4-deoxy-L-arabinose transferase-like glycosyltransferase
MENSGTRDEGSRIWFLILGAFCLAVIGSRSFFSKELWLDETITYWLTKDSFSDVMHRAVAYQGQSPLYYSIVWGSSKVFGASEMALRLPSLLALIACGVIGFKLTRKLFGELAAIIFLPLFYSLDVVQFCLSARPYALALAFCMLSFYELLLWVEGCERKHLLGYIASALLMLYAHYIYGLAFVAQLLFVLIRSDRKKNLPTLVVAWSVIAVFFAPTLFQLSTLFARRATLSFSAMPDGGALAQAILPIPFIVIVFFGLIFAKVTFKECTVLPAALWERNRLALLVPWLAVAQVVLFAYSHVTGQPLFIDRYYSWSLGALAIMGSGILVAIKEPRPRFAACLIACIFIVGREAARERHYEGWKKVAEMVTAESNGKSGPVLVQPGLIEAQQLEWLGDEERKSYLLSPFSYYKASAPFVIIPPRLNEPESAAYVLKLLTENLNDEKSFLIVCYRAKSGFKEFFEKQGKKLTTIFESRDLELLRAE